MDEAPVAEAARGARRGVVFVHGVGSQGKSDTLLDFGGPLLDFLQRWYAARGEPGPIVEEAALSFAPVDAGPTDRPSCARVRLANGETWAFAEAWWAGSNRRPTFFTMLGWSFRYLGDVIAQLIHAAQLRFSRLLEPRPSHADPGWVARGVDLVNSLGLLVLYPLGALIGYVVLIPLLLLAQVPLTAVQDFVLVRLIRPFLQVNAGEFRTYLDEDLQAANIHRRVAGAVTALLEQERCDDVVIVAHSEGCVVSFGMLTDPTYAPAAARVRKLITLGEGLNKSWLVKPGLERLHGPLPAHIVWLDIWSSYDPVPAGWLQPPEPKPGQWIDVFQPSEEVIRIQRLEPRATPDPYSRPHDDGPPPVHYWPESAQVTNEMNVLSDHGGYFDNDEQVLVRLAAEIDAPFYRESRFWNGDRPPEPDERYTPTILEAVRQRRVRVAWLAVARDALIVVALGAAFVWADDVGAALRSSPIARPVLGMLGWLRQLLGGPAALFDALEQAFLRLLGAAIVGLPFFALYQSGRALVWEPYDKQERDAAIRAIATATPESPPLPADGP